LQLVGPRLYVSFEKSFRQYNLADRTDHYAINAYEGDSPKIRELMLTEGYVVEVNAPVDHGPSPLPSIRLLMYGRYRASDHTTRESGHFDYDPLLQEPSGIVAWQTVDGGFVYLNGSQVLHKLVGAE
jgi:hypothetical protein